MASSFYIGEKSLFVSNSRFGALIDFALQVASNEEENDYIKKLEELSGSFFPGSDLDLENDFSNTEEKIFWSKVFQAVAHKVFLREIGNIQELNWQPSLICDSVSISRMLQDYTNEKLPYTEKFF